MGIELYIPIDSLKKQIESIFEDIDEYVINNPDGVDKVVQPIADQLFNYKIYGNDTPLDYFIYGYVCYKTGYSHTKEELETIANPWANDTDTIVKGINNVIYKPSKSALVKLLSPVELELDSLIKPANNSWASKGLVKVASKTFKNVGDVWKYIGKKVLVTKSFGKFFGNWMVSFLSGSVIDEDVPDDNNLYLVLEI